MTTLLSVEDLRVQYSSRYHTFDAVKHISFDLHPQEILGIVGESGAGKSTIGKAIMGVLESGGSVTQGRITLEGTELQIGNDAFMQSIRGVRIGMIFQDPMTALNPLMTVKKQLLDTILHHQNISQQEAVERAAEFLRDMDFPDPHTYLLRYPHQLSGGQRQRVVIALALCANPQVIIADEPVTALDVSVQAMVLQLLKKTIAKRGIGVVLITHDMGVIEQVSDRIMVMYKGEVVEMGDTQSVINAPQQPYSKSLMAAVPSIDKPVGRFVNVNFIEQSAENSVESVPEWLLDSSDMTHNIKDAGSTTDSGLLQVDCVHKRFLQHKSLLPSRRVYFEALKDVSFSITRGETLGIVGESGSGKSTLARIICGLHQADGGQLSYDGQSLPFKNRLISGRKIQMIFQDPFSSLNQRLNARRILTETMSLHFPSLSTDEKEQRSGDLLRLVGLPEGTLQKYPHQLSGGQCQRLCIARALSMKPQFLVCDEPTSALDVSVQAQILNLFKDLQEALHLTLLFVSHSLPVVRQMCNEIMVLKSGEVVEHRSTHDLFSTPQHQYTKELLSLIPGKHRR